MSIKKLSNLLHNNVVILIIFFVLTFPAYSYLLKPDVMTGHDMEGHIVRLIEFDEAFNDGHFPVRWAPRINYGLGYAYFNFNYPFVYYFLEIFLKIGLSYADAIKVLLLLTFPFSGWFMYLWLKRLFNGISSFIGALFYTFIPYHFLNVYVRGAIGEAVALTFVPLIFYSTERVMKKTTVFNVALLAVGWALVIGTHNITALLAAVIWGIYCLIRLHFRINIRIVLPLFFGFIWGCGLSAFFLVPALYYKQITNLDGLKEYFTNTNNYIPFNKLLYSPWGHGFSNVGRDLDEMSLQIGLMHIGIFVLGIGLLFIFAKKMKKDLLGLIIFCYLLTVVSIYLITNNSTEVWKAIPILQYVQFPWRMLAIVSITTAFIAAFVFFCLEEFGVIIAKKIPHHKIIILTLLCLFSFGALLYVNRNHWKPQQYNMFQERYVKERENFGTTTFANEHLTKWHSKEEEKIPYKPYQLFEGEAKIQEGSRSSVRHTYHIEVAKRALIADRTDFFPGWEVIVNKGGSSSIIPVFPEIHGLVAFYLEPGSYDVEVRFKETPIMQIGDGISVISFTLLLFVLLFQRAKKFKYER